MSTETETTTVAELSAEQLPELARKEASVWELATIIAGSRDFPSARTPEKAAVRILAGREMGVGPVASVIGIRVEAGRVSMDATLMAGCIKRSEIYDYAIVVHTAEQAVLRFFERGEHVGESAFSWDDAKKAGLDKKDTWKSYPRNMLFARALSNGARWYCPAIFGGAIYTHEEIGLPTDSNGEIIDSGGVGSGSDLCTKEQRTAIRGLIAQTGSTEAKFCKEQNLKMLDELSDREAQAVIKGLRKTIEKQNAALDARKGTGDGGQGTEMLTPAQQLLQDSLDDSQKPATRTQVMEICRLAEQLCLDEDERAEMFQAVLTARSVGKISQLSALQAMVLIEGLEKKLAESAGNFQKTPA